MGSEPDPRTIKLVTHALRARTRRELSRDQRAVLNLGRFRHAVEYGTPLAYFDHPRHGAEAGRLAADAQQLGAPRFGDVLHAAATVGTLVATELPWDGVLLDLLDEITAELLRLEAEAGSLWSVLACRIAATPERYDVTV